MAKELARLDTSHNPTLIEEEEAGEEVHEFEFEIDEGDFVMVTEVSSDPGDPRTLEEALARPNGEEGRDATRL